MSHFESGCKSCQLARRMLKGRLVNEVIPLGCHWTVNQYEGGNKFAGWLVMQPKQHAMALSELCEEARADWARQLEGDDWSDYN